jgi:hypothetical protein
MSVMPRVSTIELTMEIRIEASQQKPESLDLYGEARRGSAMAKARISWELVAHTSEFRGPND